MPVNAVLDSLAGSYPDPFHAQPNYLGLVATRTRSPNAFAASNFSTWICARSMHFARDVIVNPRLIYGNFYVADSTSVEAVAGAGTIKAAVEYPLGTITPCSEGTIAFPNGLTALNCPVTIPKGAQFWVRVLVTNANGTPFCSLPGYVATDAFNNGTGTAQDQVNSGTILASTGNGFPPVAIVAATRNPSVAVFGDSRAHGSVETATDASGDVGDLGRSIGPSFAYTCLANNGGRCDQFLTGHAYRDQIAAYCTHVINQYGFNDRAFGRTAAQVAADRATFAALYPGRTVIGATLYNSTATTDNWATLLNQTVNVNDVQSLNALVRAGIAGEAFYFDVERALDPTGTGKFPVNGAAFYSTPDGTHLGSVGSLLVKNSGVIQPARILRT